MWRLGAVLVVGVLVLTGCGGVQQTPEQITASLNAQANRTAAADHGGVKPYHFDGHGANVSRAQFGKRWPLTVESGRVNCIPLIHHRIAVVFTTDDRRYFWFNGVAQHQRDALETRSPSTIRLPGHDRGFALLRHVCDPLMK